MPQNGIIIIISIMIVIITIIAVKRRVYEFKSSYWQ